MELVGTRTQERGWERLFYSNGVDTRRSKGEKEIKDHSEKDCQKREGGKYFVESNINF